MIISVPVMTEVTVVSAPPEVTVIGAEAAETPVPVTAVLGVVIAVVGVTVVAVVVLARLISGLVVTTVEPPNAAGLEVTVVAAALPAVEEIRAPAAVEGVDALPLPREAEVRLLAPEVFSASRIATLSSSAFFSTLCFCLISSAHSCRCCLSCSRTFSTARSISTSALSL